MSTESDTDSHDWRVEELKTKLTMESSQLLEV